MNTYAIILLILSIMQPNGEVKVLVSDPLTAYECMRNADAIVNNFTTAENMLLNDEAYQDNELFEPTQMNKLISVECRPIEIIIPRKTSRQLL